MCPLEREFHWVSIHQIKCLNTWKLSKVDVISNGRPWAVGLFECTIQMDTRLDFPGIQIFTRSHEEISGVWAADGFCTNEREYPLRLDTSQSHFKWWLAARQEMLSSSKYFLNTTKYLYKSPLPWFLRSEDLSTERPAQRHSGHQAAQCSWSRVSVPSAPVWHAAGPGLPPLATWGIGRCQ